MRPALGMPQAVAVDPPRRRTRLTVPLHPVGRLDGEERADAARDPSGHVPPSPATGPVRGSTGPRASVRRRLSGAAGSFRTEALLG